MPPDPILEALRRKPFAPFRLFMADSATFDVRHPEMIIIGQGHLALGMPSKAEPMIAERIVTLSLGHIVRIEPLRAKAKGNGQSGGTL